MGRRHFQCCRYEAILNLRQTFEAVVVAEPSTGRKRKSAQTATDSTADTNTCTGSDLDRVVKSRYPDSDALEISSLLALKDIRIYNVSEKSFLHSTSAHGFWIGTEFDDSGLAMVVTKVGQVYRWGNKKLIDVEAMVRRPENVTTPSL